MVYNHRNLLYLAVMHILNYPLAKRRTIKILLFVFSFLYTFSSFAQNQTAKSTTTSSIWYYEYLPDGYSTSTDNYPVVFFMHGLGERGNLQSDLTLVSKHGPPKWVKNGTKFPFILISPQLKTNYGDWPPWYIDEVVEYCRTYLRIDPRRIYITGMSLGGGGAWYYAQTYPNKVAALAPVCGSRNLTSKACDLVNNKIPVWAFHGDKDSTVPLSRSVNMINAMNACVPAPNPAPILTIYPGVGHNAWDNAYRPDNTIHNPNVYQWMMMQVNGGVTVNAGKDVTINLPTNSTTIAGSASTESGSITSYAWTKVSGPSVTISNATSPTLSLTNLVAGVYTFRLTATNSSGDTGNDEVKITVIQTNVAPVANAGSDLSITLPTNSASITGIGSDSDGTIASYSWTKNSGPLATISGQNTATLNLTNLLEGTYVFTLTVTDNLGATGTDQVNIVVNPAAINQKPTVNAGADKTVNLPTSTLNITAVASDPDGSIANYLWEKTSGPSVTINNSNASTVSLSSLVAGNYVFRITVTDNQGATAFDEVAVTVIAANQSPSANAGADIVITLPTSVTNIVGSGLDPDGSISGYLWSQVSGPNTAALANATTSTVTVSGLIQGIYRFKLTVTDDKGATGLDEVLVTVNAAPVNVAPTVNAGTDRNITLPLNTVTLNGTANDVDGTIAQYAWTKTSGPAATLTGQTTSSLVASDLIAGTYIFRLTVTDNQGATNFDEVNVVVQPQVVNQSPSANAGADVTLVLPANSVTINGSGNDVDGSIASYSWTKVSGPSVTISGQNTSSLSLNSLVQGSYVFRLTVTDNLGASGSDDVSVTVNAANSPPTANAGPNITLNLPVNSTTISGNGTDPDGSIVSFSWTQVTGPNTATLANANTITVSVSNLVQGTYTFRLTVTDNNGATGNDEMNVVVNAANQAPVANAGSDQTITLPTNTTNLSGNGTDADGTITSYAWQQRSGPASATFSNSNTPTVTVTVGASGTYTFRLTVTDNQGATGFDEVVLIVNPAAVNQPPIVNAGPNQTITLPLNSINLTGTASDPDGSISSSLWSKISGPSATLTNTNTLTLSISDLVQGTYLFRLSVTDNGGLSAQSDVTINVLPATVNQPPSANAGADKTITLPTNNTTLNGAGSDPDGTVISYLWEKVNGPSATLLNITNPVLTIQDLVAGVYDFRLTVTDDKGATASDLVKVTVNAIPINQPPIANAGADKSVALPTNILTLTGSGSDIDGTVVKYTWTKVSGPSVTLANANTPSLSLSGLVEGTYTFRLEVEDDKGAVSSDDVIVNVLAAVINKSPVVSSGGDKSLFLPTNSVTLNGSASDPDGTIASIIWTQVSGPNTATLTNSNTVTLMVSNLIEGTYVFRITATDNSGATSFAESQVVVNAAIVNQPPAADAGSDITIKLPVNNVTLNGSGNDPDGTIASFQWTKESGPPLTITNSNSASASLTNMVEGIYSFKLTVTDNDGATGSDLITITVLPASINNTPLADAGSDVNVVLPSSGLTLVGKATDDGTIASTIWTKTSGPAASLSGSNTLTLTVSNLVEGAYVFRLTVTDNGGLTAFDEVNVNVFPAPVVNPPPTVEAGDPVKIQLPVDSVKVIAEVNSSSGLIEKYQWSQLDGDLVQIDPDSTETLFIKNLKEGKYSFRITVTDGENQSASDDVLVTVESSEVKPSNVFSPNNDGLFETWTISGSGSLSGCSIMVKDRQGNTVFESIGYDTEWNGTFRGQILPAGAYFYSIQCSGQKTITGSVTIIR